jgi:phospholipid transport system substrate-binding protein
MHRISYLLLLIPFASALADAPDPRTRIEERYAAIQRIVLENDTEEEVQRQVVEVLESFTDFHAFSQRTLKSSWADLTEAQQNLFVDRYRLLIHKSYVKHFKPNKTLTVTFRTEPRIVGDKALVQTTVRSGSSSADVDYKLHLRDGNYQAYDIVIDDVSLMRSYRRQFARIMRDQGFDELIRRINSKIETGNGDVDEP